MKCYARDDFLLYHETDSYQPATGWRFKGFRTMGGGSIGEWNEMKWIYP